MNPAAGILVLLLALWMLLAYFSGRLEWLFRLRSTVGADGPTPLNDPKINHGVIPRDPVPVDRPGSTRQGGGLVLVR